MKLKNKNVIQQFNKEKRQFLVCLNRQKIFENLLSDFSALKIETEAAHQTFQSKNVRICTLETLDPQTHSIRVIPTGKFVSIVSNFNEIIIRDKKKSICEIHDIKTDAFDLTAIYSCIDKAYYVSQFNSFRKFNYSKIAGQVASFLIKSHFPRGEIINTPTIQIKMIPDLCFSIPLLNQLRSVELSLSNCIEVRSTITCAQVFRLYSRFKFLKKKFNIFLNLENGVLKTADGIRIDFCSEMEIDSGVAKISFLFQRIRQIKYLNELLKQKTNKNGIEFENDENWSLNKNIVEVGNKKYQKKKVLQINALIEFISNKIEEIESSVF